MTIIPLAITYCSVVELLLQVFALVCMVLMENNIVLHRPNF